MNSTRVRNGRWGAGWFSGVLLTTLSGWSEPWAAALAASPRGDRDFLTLKYRDTGDLEWAVCHDGSGDGPDGPVADAVDAQGHVLVAGDSVGANGSYDLLVLKYDPTGHLLWTYRYDGPARYTDRLAAMRLDAGGHIHLAGIYFSDSFAFLVKYAQQTVPGMPLATVTPVLHVVERGTEVVFIAEAVGTAPIH